MRTIAVVGSAYVDIRAVTTKLRSDIKKALDEATRDMDVEGEKAGKKYAQGFAKGVKLNLADALEGSVLDAGKDMDTVGELHAGEYQKGFNSAIRANRLKLRELVDRESESASQVAAARGEATGRSLGDGVTRGMTASSGDWGGFTASLQNAFGNVEWGFFDRGADGARRFDIALGGLSDTSSRFSLKLSDNEKAGIAMIDAFTRMNVMMQAIGSGMSTVVSGLSTVIQSVVLLGSALGRVIPLLGGGLLAGIGGLIGGFATMGLAFGGVGDAVKAMNDQVDKGAGSAGKSTAAANAVAAAQKRAADAARAVRDAEEALQDTRERNERRLADALKSVLKAQQSVLQAQRGLNEARERAVERIQDLMFALEQGAISEERALIALERAREQVAELAELPPDNRMRREAELALAQADLSYRQAIDRNKDLAKEEENFKKTGIEGTKEVVDAKERIADAEERLRDAVEDQARARVEAQRAERDAMESLARALENQREAYNGIGDAVSGVGAGVDKIAQAMSRLSPEAQTFARYIASIRPEVDKLRAAAGKEMFPLLEAAIDNLVTNLFPALEPILQRIGRALGVVAIKFSSVVTEAGFLKSLDTLFAAMAPAMETLGFAAANVLQAFADIAAAAAPQVQLFAEWIEKVSGAWAESVRLRSETGILAAEMESRAETFKTIGTLLGNVGAAFKAIFSAAEGPGLQFLQFLTDLSGKWREFAESDVGQEKYTTLFQGIADNMEEIVPLISEALQIFRDLGADPSVGETAKIIREDWLPSIRGILETLNEGGPIFAEFGGHLLKIVEKFAEMQVLEKLITFINPFVEGFANFVEAIPPSFIDTLGNILAVLLGFKALGMGAGLLDKLTSGFVGNLRNMANVATLGLFKDGKVGSQLLDGLFDPNNMDIDSKAGKFGQTLAGKLKTSVGGALGKIPMGNLGGALFGDLAGSMAGLSGPARALGGALNFLSGPLGIILTVAGLLIPILIDLYKNNENFRNSIDRILGAIMGLVGTVLDALMPVIETVGQVLADLVEALTPLLDIFTEVATPILELVAEVLADVLTPALELFGQIFGTVIGNLAPVIKGMASVVIPIIGGIADLLKAVLVPAFEFLFTIVKWVMERFVNIIQTGFKIIDWVWTNILSPFFGYFRSAFEALPGFVDGIVKWIGRTWEGIVEFFRKPIRTVIDFINRNLIGPLNNLGKLFDFHISPIVVNFAEGGFVGPRKNFTLGGAVSGAGGPTSDKIPANLSNGEYVIPTKRVREYGLPLFDAIRKGTYDPNAHGGENIITTFGEALLGRAVEFATGPIRSAINAVISPVKNIPLIGDMITGILDALFEKIKSWATGRDEEEAKKAAATAGGRVPPYTGPEDGWTFPLGIKVRWTTYPGHSNRAVDFAAPTGTPIRAATRGVISRMQQLGTSYGWWIEMAHAGGLKTRYAHMSRFGDFKVGQVVPTGSVIGFVGSTGNSTGPHLHFEVIPASWANAAYALKSKGVVVPGLAQGGVVKATSGGVLSLIGEAGKHERVEPLDREGLSKRDRVLIASIVDHLTAGKGVGGGDTFVIQPSKGMSEVELASQVSRQVSWRKRRSSV